MSNIDKCCKRPGETNSIKGGTHIKVVMMHYGTPIIILRTVELRQFDHPIGVVRMFTLYAKGIEDIKYKDQRKFPILKDSYYHFLGLNGHRYLLRGIEQGTFEHFSKNGQKNCPNKYSDDFLLGNLKTYGPQALSDHYLVCNITKSAGCSCHSRVHGIKESDAANLCFNINFFPGRPYYVFGYGMFSSQPIETAFGSVYTEYGILVYMDGHVYLFHSSFIASLVLFNGLPLEDNMVLKHLKASSPPLLSKNFVNFLSRISNTPQGYPTPQCQKFFLLGGNVFRFCSRFDMSNLSMLAVRDLRGTSPILRRRPIVYGKRSDPNDLFIMAGCPIPIIPPDSCLDFVQFTNLYLSQIKSWHDNGVMTITLWGQSEADSESPERANSSEEKYSSDDSSEQSIIDSMQLGISQDEQILRTHLYNSNSQCVKPDKENTSQEFFSSKDFIFIEKKSNSAPVSNGYSIGERLEGDKVKFHSEIDPLDMPWKPDLVLGGSEDIASISIKSGESHENFCSSLDYSNRSYKSGKKKMAFDGGANWLNCLDQRKKRKINRRPKNGLDVLDVSQKLSTEKSMENLAKDSGKVSLVKKGVEKKRITEANSVDKRTDYILNTSIVAGGVIYSANEKNRLGLSTSLAKNSVIDTLKLASESSIEKLKDGSSLYTKNIPLSQSGNEPTCVSSNSTKEMFTIKIPLRIDSVDSDIGKTVENSSGKDFFKIDDLI